MIQVIKRHYRESKMTVLETRRTNPNDEFNYYLNNNNNNITFKIYKHNSHLNMRLTHYLNNKN